MELVNVDFRRQHVQTDANEPKHDKTRQSDFKVNFGPLDLPRMLLGDKSGFSPLDLPTLVLESFWVTKVNFGPLDLPRRLLGDKREFLTTGPAHFGARRLLGDKSDFLTTGSATLVLYCFWVTKVIFGPLDLPTLVL